jgi:hypothetical protein
VAMSTRGGFGIDGIKHRDIGWAAAAHIQHTPIVIMLQPCKIVDEWLERYGNRNPS